MINEIHFQHDDPRQSIVTADDCAIWCYRKGFIGIRGDLQMNVDDETKNILLWHDLSRTQCDRGNGFPLKSKLFAVGDDVILVTKKKNSIKLIRLIYFVLGRFSFNWCAIGLLSSIDRVRKVQARMKLLVLDPVCFHILVS